MKLLKFLNPKKDKLRRQAYKSKVSPTAQTSGSELFLNKLIQRKRSITTPKIILRKHHGLAKKIFVTVVLISLLAYAIYKFKPLDYFKISLVEINGALKFVNEKDIKTLAEKNSLNQSIFLINTNYLSEVLKKNFLGAKNIDIEKKYPDKLKIIVEERTPLAVVYTDKEDYYLIDSDGYVLGIVDKRFSDLPKIKYEGEVSVGSFLEKEMIPVSVEILKFAEKEELKVSSISFYPKYTKVYVGTGAEIYIGYDKDREQSMKTVGSLIKKLSVEGKIVKKIDLRYDKVIVLYD